MTVADRLEDGEPYDVVVVGSGFGGSVAALRLAEKGYRVLVVEAGRRFDETTYPKTSWDLRNFLWAPRLGCRGIQRISLLRDVVVLSGAGVGGGSLVYANTLYEPSEAFYTDPQWQHITDWRDELAPHIDQARRMLGVTRNPTITAADDVMRDVAEEMGVGHTFTLTPVGVFFGDAPGVEVADPYFGGAGPRRTGCVECGACMTGCRVGAKNTLPKNYLHLAQAAGARVVADTTVTRVRPRPEGGYDVATEHAPRGGSRQRAAVRADQVVFAAGALGTQRLLHRMRDEGHLPRLSPCLGVLTRTNSEALVGAKALDRSVDYSRGVAITSSFHLDDETHVEPVRYGRGSNAMGLLSTMLVDGSPADEQRRTLPRWMRFVAAALRHPVTFGRAVSVRHWSERTVIVLVMQSLDNSLTTFTRRGLGRRRRMTSRQGHGKPNPVWIPLAHDAVRRLSRRIGGVPGGTWGDVANVPMTAHIIGGVVIGDSPDTGVVDPYQRVFGYEGLHVMDGAAVSANLGVNPSLTITAQAERATSMWPNAGEPDPRPALGEPYRRVAPVAPRAPVVPSSAVGALRNQ